MGTAVRDILDYVKNAEKTDKGKFITSYQCNGKIADAEFLFSKRQYLTKAGRSRGKDDVIAYQVWQSFAPARSPQRIPTAWA